MLRLRSSSNGFPKQFITSSISTTINHLLQFSDVASTTSINPKTQNKSPLSSSIGLTTRGAIAATSVLNFLRESGFKDTQIRCLLSTPALFSSSDVEKTLKSKIKVFLDLGLSVPVIKRSNLLIQPNILFLTKKCGGKNQKFLLSNARHFKNKPDRVDDDEKNSLKEKDLIEKGPNSPMETILGEVRIRFMWTSFGLGMTWFTCYWFSEEFIFLLAKPFLTLNSDSHFVCIQLTEALSTYLATASTACAYFVFPLLSYQLWSFLIPSCYEEQRMKYNRVFRLSGFSFAFFLCLTFSYVVPNIWHFLYSMCATSTNLLMITLQPKIYDYIMLTLRISLISSVCSQVPVLLISLLEQKALSVESFTNNRRYLMLFSLFTAALSTPPDIWCQIVACSVLYSTIELAMFVALVKQVREGVE
ncbi:hypothetical protein C5167_007744 [Papaver somniferum]|uniref:uncharacterized protein LOC113325828 n=1 Tax=Papaver somniferum TaxID=3469 RepID=UPI000E705BD1|nr:uncharacterized protein LOC113325828 [Papaver somniferum]RZC85132.1 hypothetical protein C5167_007744 [Papaver somniferum]